MNEDLFLYSLKTNNVPFIKESLLQGAFDASVFTSNKVVTQNMKFMEDGSKTLQCLNTLLLTST